MKIVLDAHIVLAWIIPTSYSQAASRKLQEWLEKNDELLVPSLCYYEVTSALSSAVAIASLSSDLAAANLQDILSVPIRQVPPSAALQLRTLEWAALLNQKVAYDAAYLALAEAEGAHFWSCDRQLTETAVKAGAFWVHHISEASSEKR